MGRTESTVQVARVKPIRSRFKIRSLCKRGFAVVILNKQVGLVRRRPLASCVSRASLAYLDDRVKLFRIRSRVTFLGRNRDI